MAENPPDARPWVILLTDRRRAGAPLKLVTTGRGGRLLPPEENPESPATFADPFAARRYLEKIDGHYGIGRWLMPTVDRL